MTKLFPVLRFVLAAVFLYAGVVKTSASAQFALTLVPFTFVPPSLLPWIAVILPGVEIAAGLLLLIGPTKKAGAALIFLLCLMFGVVLTWALANGIIVSCSCFGRDETPSAWKMMLALGRDVLLAGAAAAVFFEEALRRPWRTPDTVRKTRASG